MSIIETMYPCICDLVSLLWFYATICGCQGQGARQQGRSPHARSHHWWDRSHRKLSDTRLVEAGHALTCVSRGMKQPYQVHHAWKAVTLLELDRTAEENAGTFGERIASLDAEVVIDLTCYRLESAKELVETLRGRIGHLLHCGTIWVHGPSIEVPTTEEEPRKPFGEYGIRKAAIEAYLLQQAREERFPVTILHPGHLVGAGWAPINPTGNFNPEVFSTLMQGGEICLPNLGLETVHHVHVDNMAQAFMRAMEGATLHWVSAFTSYPQRR